MDGGLGWSFFRRTDLRKTGRHRASAEFGGFMNRVDRKKTRGQPGRVLLADRIFSQVWESASSPSRPRVRKILGVVEGW